MTENAYDEPDGSAVVGRCGSRVRHSFLVADTFKEMDIHQKRSLLLSTNVQIANKLHWKRSTFLVLSLIEEVRQRECSVKAFKKCCWNAHEIYTYY